MNAPVIEQKPQLSFWNIINMGVGFFGIQVGLALQNANMSRIFQTLGAEESKLAILWLAAPVTGLLVQPIIGYMSDKTWNFIGRRKPYFLAGALLASLALIVVPNSQALWMAAGLLWILDASINISMEPFRALVADMLSEKQRPSGFAVQSFFIGIGSVLASSLPYILNHYFNIGNSIKPGRMIQENVEIAFYFGAFLFLSTIIWTIWKTKEYPPEVFARYNGEIPQENKQGFGTAISSIITDFVNMPSTMKKLGAVQFFSWVGLFSLWIYTSPAVARHIFNATDSHSKAFSDAGDWVGVCFSVYNAVAALAAFILPILAIKTSVRSVHAICLIAGGIGLSSILFISNQYTLLFSMVGIGIAWSSILSMPYTLLSGALPPHKMGIYMGFFNFFIVLPQITAALILGYFVKNLFGNDSIYALLLGGICMGIAAILTLMLKPVNKL